MNRRRMGMFDHRFNCLDEWELPFLLQTCVVSTSLVGHTVSKDRRIVRFACCK